MKKISLILVLIMAVLAVNAQITRVAVKSADLPKAIHENLTKNYAGYTIKESTKVTENNVVTYDVAIVKGTSTETLVYDKDGKFLRKAAPKTAPPANTGQKPAEKSAPAKK
jgi:hypothetical protein